MRLMILKICLLIAVAFTLTACPATPPVPWPNVNEDQLPDAGGSAPQVGDAREDLPIDVVYPEGGGEDDTSDSLPLEGGAEGQEQELEISSSSSKIYAKDGDVTEANRTLITITGAVPDSVVDISGVAYFDDTVTISPPAIDQTDLDSDEDNIQLRTDESGTLKFWLIAGESTGNFYLIVRDDLDSDSVYIEIAEPL